MNTLGTCPTCGEPGSVRERRPFGDTTCGNGHKHKSTVFDATQQKLMDAVAPENLGRCVECGAPGKSIEKRPNGNTTCMNGHSYSTKAFQRHEEQYQVNHGDQDYRARMDVACEALGMALVEIGTGNEALNDDQLVELATRKLKTLHRMLATTMSAGLLAAVMSE